MPKMRIVDLHFNMLRIHSKCLGFLEHVLHANDCFFDINPSSIINSINIRR